MTGSVLTGSSPGEAMREAAPLFARPPYARDAPSVPRLMLEAASLRHGGDPTAAAAPPGPPGQERPGRAVRPCDEDFPLGIRDVLAAQAGTNDRGRHSVTSSARRTAAAQPQPAAVSTGDERGPVAGGRALPQASQEEAVVAQLNTLAERFFRDRCPAAGCPGTCRRAASARPCGTAGRPDTRQPGGPPSPATCVATRATMMTRSRQAGLARPTRLPGDPHRPVPGPDHAPRAC